MNFYKCPKQITIKEVEYFNMGGYTTVTTSDGTVIDSKTNPTGFSLWEQGGPVESGQWASNQIYCTNSTGKALSITIVINVAFSFTAGYSASDTVVANPGTNMIKQYNTYQNYGGGKALYGSWNKGGTKVNGSSIKSIGGNVFAVEKVVIKNAVGLCS